MEAHAAEEAAAPAPRRRVARPAVSAGWGFFCVVLVRPWPRSPFAQDCDTDAIRALREAKAAADEAAEAARAAAAAAGAGAGPARDATAARVRSAERAARAADSALGREIDRCVEERRAARAEAALASPVRTSAHAAARPKKSYAEGTDADVPAGGVGAAAAAVRLAGARRPCCPA